MNTILSLKSTPVYTIENLTQYPLNPYREFVHYCATDVFSHLEHKVNMSLKDFKDLPKDKIVLNNMIRMLKELDVEITAEGVESEEQIDFLNDCGCQVIQGYIFDHPLPHDEFEQRLINRKY
jgi:argonaute-like protein implicated in RNA metabolism and viral defense